MYQNWKKVFVTVLLVLPLIMLAGGNGQAGEKNPCAKNPCVMKNPCAKNPCAANPCAMKPKPIRKAAIKDNAKLMEIGEKLWSDTKLGTSGTACATCHPDGQGLKNTPFPKYLKMPDDILTLDQMINFCMKNPMKGKPLQWNSLEMTALAAYVQSHAKEEGEPANPCAAKNPCMMENPCGMKNPCGKK
jgi:cytochrome c